jgi:hypothetical protein
VANVRLAGRPCFIQGGQAVHVGLVCYPRRRIYLSGKCIGADKSISLRRVSLILSVLTKMNTFDPFTLAVKDTLSKRNW